MWVYLVDNKVLAVGRLHHGAALLRSGVALRSGAALLRSCDAMSA